MRCSVCGKYGSFGVVGAQPVCHRCEEELEEEAELQRQEDLRDHNAERMESVRRAVSDWRRNA
jgi:hypothetical protein